MNNKKEYNMKIKDFIKKYFPNFKINGFETYRSDDNELFYLIKCENNIVINVSEKDLKQASSDNYIY